MKRKSIILILSLLMSICCLFGITACGQSAECDHSGASIVIPEVAGTCQSEGKSAGKKCARCGFVIEEPVATEKGSHVYGTEYQKDADKHWKVCTLCEEKSPAEDHTGGTANCGEQKKCEVCNESYGETMAHEFTNVYGSDATNHWIKCNHCDAIKENSTVAHEGGSATCTEKPVCTVCEKEYGTVAEHDFANGQLKSDDTYHWNKCKNCDAENPNKEVHSGGTATCTEDAKCTVCETIYKTKLGHDFVNGIYKNDIDGHWKKCSRCDVEDVTHKAEHDGGVATCTVKATCADCGVTYGELKDHDFENGTYVSGEEDHWKKCANCDIENGSEKEKHTGGVATCVEKATCEICQAAYGTVGGHDIDEAIFLSDGNYHWNKCKNCDTTENKVRHDGGTASCSTLAKCSTCNTAYGNYADHDFTGAYKYDKDRHWRTCAVCGTEDTNQAFHSGGTATCVDRKVCEACSQVYGELADHKFSQTNDHYDQYYHSPVCTVAGCGALGTPQAHTPNIDEPTATQAKVCTGCKYEFAPATNHEHVRKDKRDYNGTQHWFACIADETKPDCEYIFLTTREDHVFDSVCDTTCNICDYTRAVQHNFSNGDYMSNGTQHWRRCAVCYAEDTNKSNHVGGTATCTSQKQCTICSTYYGEMLDHDFDNGTYKYDTEGHWKTCANCSAQDAANKVAHGGGTATCTDKAVCSSCNQTYGEAQGHNMSTTWTTDGSNHWKKCTRSGCSYTDSKSAHTGGTATCTAKKKCTTCSKEYGSVLGHTYTTKYGSDSDLHWLICDRCSYADKDNALYHEGGTATCTAQKKCTTCGTSYGNKLSHSLTAYASNGTQHWAKCKNCSYADTSIKTNCAGGTATCTAKAKCSTCGNQYGSLKSHSYVAKTSATQHWKACSSCGAEQSGSRANHSMTAYATDATNHWKKCASCTYADTSTKTAHAGGTPTESAQPKCSTCNASYGYKLVKHTVGSFDNDSYLYMAGGTANDFWCWPRHIGTSTMKTGTGALQIEPHATDGQWPGIKFNHNGSNLWNLSKATSISVTTCSGASAQGTLFLQLKDANGKTHQVKVTGTANSWITTTIKIADAKNAGVNVASCYVSFEANYALVSEPNRKAIYLDDLCVYESVGDTSWDTVYIASTYNYFDKIGNGVRPDGANATSPTDIDYVVEDSWDWQPMVDLDKRLGSVGRGLVLTKQGTGDWPGVYLKDKGNKTFNFSKTAYIKLWVYNDGTGNIASGAMTLQVRTTAGAGLTTELAVTKAISKGEWAEYIIDVAAYRKANPSVSLTSCWLHFGNHASTYPAAATVLRLENFEVISQP